MQHPSLLAVFFFLFFVFSELQQNSALTARSSTNKLFSIKNNLCPLWKFVYIVSPLHVFPAVVYQEKCKYNQTADHFLFLPTRKKLSNFSNSSNWKSASNYVAKRYMEPVDRNVYFEDVRLQMEAKLWGEEYNRHRPPKQVEQACWLAFMFTCRAGILWQYCQSWLLVAVWESSAITSKQISLKVNHQSCNLVSGWECLLCC